MYVLSAKISLVFVLIGSLTLLSGCGNGASGPSYGSDDGKKIAILVEELNEAVAHPKVFQQSFAGKAPAEWKRYGQMQYEVSGNPTVNGATATAKVKIVTDGGDEKGTSEWSFEKVGDTWKISSAPLP